MAAVPGLVEHLVVGAQAEDVEAVDAPGSDRYCSFFHVSALSVREFAENLG